MKTFIFRAIAIALVALSAATFAFAADQHPLSIRPAGTPISCRVTGDIVLCFTLNWRVDAYSSEPGAEAYMECCAAKLGPAFLLTTTDPVRRALVVYPTSDVQTPGNGYAAELYANATDARARWIQLSDDQQASGFRLPFSDLYGDSGVLVVYRHYPCDAEGR